MKTSELKFEVVESLEPRLSSNGRVRILGGKYLVTEISGVVKIGNFQDTVKTAEIGDEEDPVYATETTDNSVFTAHKSGLIREWVPESNRRMWNPRHSQPLIHLASSKTGDNFVSVSTDKIVKHWDVSDENPTCKGVFRGLTSFPTVVVILKGLLYVGADDGKVFIWSLDHRTAPIKILEKHYSQVDTIILDDNSLFTHSKDNILVSWAPLQNYEPLKVLPTLTQLHSFQIYDEEFLIAGGDKGNFRLYHKESLKIEAFSHPHLDLSRLEPCPITCILKTDTGGFLFVQDGLLSFLEKDSFESYPTNAYEILDLILMEERIVITAHNTNCLYMYDLKHSRHRVLNVKESHEDSIVSLSGKEDIFISGSKDKTAVLWRITNYDLMEVEMLGKCGGYASSLTAVVLHSLSSFYTVSKDSVLKAWSFQDGALSANKTILCHSGDKGEVNSVDVSIDGRLLATGSQDKTAKLWSTDTLNLVGTLSGHRRGIWCVKFSKYDRIILTSSTDASIKIWELGSCSCLKTLQGHETSVLKCGFYNRSIVVSVSSDGILKTWNIDSGECHGTFDSHDKPVWSVGTIEDKSIFTGGADGRLLKWDDRTEEANREAVESKRIAVNREQTLDNFFQQKDWAKAFKYSLRMNKPRRALGALVALYDSNQLESALDLLSKKEMNSLTKFISDWNCFGQHAVLSQASLNSLIQKDIDFISRDHDDKTVASLLSYSRKHLERIKKLQRRSTIVELLISNMS